MKDVFSKILVIPLLISFLVYYYRINIPYIEYEINKEYIVNNLCENRDKPMMNCQGKCYLKKQVKKAQQQEKKHFPFITSENTLLFYFLPNNIEEINIFKNSLDINSYLNLYSFIFIEELLKPPRFFTLILKNYNKHVSVFAQFKFN